MNVLGQLVVSEPTTLEAEECPDCHFDALLTFPVHFISDHGVTPWGGFKACARCFENKRRSV